MTNSQTYYFVAKCLALDENPDFKNTIVEACKNNSIDWLEFISVCSENLVLQIVYIKFRSHKILEYLPKEVSQHLQEIYELNTQRNTGILNQIKSINTILNENHIYPIFLKGSGNLLDNIYTDIGERLMGDIDFLVPEDMYLKAAELMMNCGYQSDADMKNTDLMKSDHYPRLYHPDYPADIEIHRIPTDYKCGNWYNTEIVNAEKQTLTTLDGCFVQSLRHRVMLNFIHSQLSHEGYFYGWVSLKDIYDLYVLSKRIPLINVIPLMQQKGKAIAYFAFAKNAFGLDKKFFPQQNFKYRILKKKHALMLDSSQLQKLTQKYERFKAVYLYMAREGFFSKKIRTLIARKLSLR